MFIWESWHNILSLCLNLVHFPWEERFKLGSLNSWRNFEFRFGAETSRDLWPIMFLSPHGIQSLPSLPSGLSFSFSHIFTFPFSDVTLWVESVTLPSAVDHHWGQAHSWMSFTILKYMINSEAVKMLGYIMLLFFWRWERITFFKWNTSYESRY